MILLQIQWRRKVAPDNNTYKMDWGYQLSPDAPSVGDMLVFGFGPRATKQEAERWRVVSRRWFFFPSDDIRRPTPADLGLKIVIDVQPWGEDANK